MSRRVSGDKCREVERERSEGTDETEGWMREKLRGGEYKVSERRNELGRGDEQKDKRRPAL